jgi:serralysin
VLPLDKNRLDYEPADAFYDKIITGTNATNHFIGAGYDDKILGQKGNDRLEGREGNDALYGGLGRDTLTGGTGVDLFILNTEVASKRNTNIDKIRDFKPKEDVIFLEGGETFISLFDVGLLSKQAYWSGSKAHDRSDRIIYHKATGNLFYDPDGSEEQAAIKIAILPSKLKITHNDFYVF